MHRAKPTWFVAAAGGAIVGSGIASNIYNVDFTAVSEDQYRNYETKAEIIGPSGTWKMIQEGRGFGEEKGRTPEELKILAKNNWEKTKQDKLDYDKREIKDKLTDTDYAYGTIVSMLFDKSAKFYEFSDDRNRAQDAGLEISEKRVEENFSLPDGWIEESTGEVGTRYYNVNLNLYSYRHPGVKVPEKWTTVGKDILGKKYLVFQHQHGFESKILENDPELPIILKLELSSIKKSEATVGNVDFEMLSLKSNLNNESITKNDETLKNDDLEKHTNSTVPSISAYQNSILNKAIPRGWKMTIDPESPTGIGYHEKTENLLSYRNPNWLLPKGWTRKVIIDQSGNSVCLFEHESSGIMSKSIESDEAVPKELWFESS